MPDYTITEQWLPIVSWEGIYEVSNLGQVRSLDRWVPQQGRSPRFWAGCVLAQYIAGDGYKAVRLYFSGRKETRYIHSLVLETFIGPCPPRQEARHGPNGQSDNSVANLSYGTRTQNMRDKRRDGTNYNTNRVYCPRNHKLAPPNLVPSQLPKRVCLACQRARSGLGNKGWVREDFRTRADEFKTVADKHYNNILDFATSQTQTE